MLPDSVLHLFVGLFLLSLTLFVFLPAIIGYWRIAHGSLDRQPRVRLEDVPAILAALVLVNVFCYFLGSGSAHPMPHDMLRLLLLALDLPFLLFLLDILIVSFLTRRKQMDDLTPELSKTPEQVSSQN